MKQASWENQYLYNKNLKGKAATLRNTMTKAEACLWKFALRARQMKGYSFNRQRSVINYIGDFACKELRLIIEVDGYSHLLEETHVKDVKKEYVLVNSGFTVLRFTDDEVLKNMNQVKQIIWDKIEELETAPPPTPSQRGTSSE